MKNAVELQFAPIAMIFKDAVWPQLTAWRDRKWEIAWCDGSDRRIRGRQPFLKKKPYHKIEKLVLFFVFLAEVANRRSWTVWAWTHLRGLRWNQYNNSKWGSSRVIDSHLCRVHYAVYSTVYNKCTAVCSSVPAASTETTTLKLVGVSRDMWRILLGGDRGRGSLTARKQVTSPRWRTDRCWREPAHWIFDDNRALFRRVKVSQLFVTTKKKSNPRWKVTSLPTVNYLYFSVSKRWFSSKISWAQGGVGSSYLTQLHLRALPRERRRLHFFTYV